MADKQGMRPQIVQRPGKEVEAISTARAVFQRCQFDEAPSGEAVPPTLPSPGGRCGQE